LRYIFKVWLYDSGFGRSSRCYFKTDNILAENQYIGAIEKWRQAMGLEKVVLLGHSFGGYLSSAYAIKFPDRVEHLILADPWGFPERPEDVSQK
jgi:abhydrolase domain-containing protein 4